MNEPAIRTEEQIISLFQDRETLVCSGWILKKMGGCLWVYPLYYKFSQGNIPDSIRKCEEISRRNRTDCVFRIAEHTNYHLSSILTDNGYGLKNCGVVGEWNTTEEAGNFCVEGDSRYLKNVADGEDTEYITAGTDKVIGIKQQRLLFLPDGNLLCAGIEDILRFEQELFEFVDTKYPEIPESIRTQKEIKEDTEQKLIKAIEECKAQFK